MKDKNDIFSIRTRKNQEKNTHLIGAYVPQKLNSCLVLYSIAKGFPKTVIVQDVLQNWYNSTFRNNEADIKNDIISIAQHEWYLKKRIERWEEDEICEHYNSFLLHVDNELTNKRIERNVIEEIIENIKM